jgi:hypothetical protein
MGSRSLGYAVMALTIGIGDASPATDPVAQTEQTRQISVVHELASVGLAPGQTLRYVWANQATPESLEQFEPLRIVVRLLAGDATVLAQDAAEAVSAGQFQMFDFSRAAISRGGDVTTAPLQVRVEATVVGRSRFADTVLKRGAANFDDGVEIIDEATETTVVAFGRGANELSLDDTAGKEHAGRRGFQIISAGQDRFVGLVPGQSLRITAANPMPNTEDGRRFKPLFAFTLFDAQGQPIVEGDAVALEPGKSHSFEIPYSALSAAGRVQVRAEARFFHGIVSRFSAGGKAPAPVALEIVDAANGRTMVHLLQKPKEIVVVGPKTIPSSRFWQDGADRGPVS